MGRLIMPGEKITEKDALLRGLLSGSSPFNARPKNLFNPLNLNALPLALKERSKSSGTSSGL